MLIIRDNSDDTPDGMHIYSIGPSLCYSAGIVLPIVCSFFVGLRFYARKKRGLKLCWDDWLVLPALLCLIGMSATVIAGTALGVMGTPTTPENSTRHTTVTRQIIWSTYLMGIPLLTCIKVSFILWYRRLFWQGSPKWYRVALCLTLATLVIWGVSYFFSFLFLCPGHPQVYWRSLKDILTKCVKTYKVYESYATSDFILDVIVIILPMVPLYRLQMSGKRRLAITGVFLLGALTIVASILRMVTVWEACEAQYKPGTDIPLILTSAVYWGLIESAIALISCCLPTCSSLFKTKKEPKPAPTFEKRVTLDTSSSGSSAHTIVNPFIGRTSVNNCSVASYDDEANLWTQLRPNEILVTRTFASQSIPSSRSESLKKGIASIAESEVEE